MCTVIHSRAYFKMYDMMSIYIIIVIQLVAAVHCPVAAVTTEKVIYLLLLVYLWVCRITQKKVPGLDWIKFSQ